MQPCPRIRICRWSTDRNFASHTLIELGWMLTNLIWQESMNRSVNSTLGHTDLETKREEESGADALSRSIECSAGVCFFTTQAWSTDWSSSRSRNSEAAAILISPWQWHWNTRISSTLFFSWVDLRSFWTIYHPSRMHCPENTIHEPLVIGAACGISMLLLMWNISLLDDLSIENLDLSWPNLIVHVDLRLQTDWKNTTSFEGQLIQPMRRLRYFWTRRSGTNNYITERCIVDPYVQCPSQSDYFDRKKTQAKLNHNAPPG